MFNEYTHSIHPNRQHILYVRCVHNLSCISPKLYVASLLVRTPKYIFYKRQSGGIEKDKKTDTLPFTQQGPKSNYQQ